MDNSNEIVKTISISALRANVIIILIFVPVFIIANYTFILIWGIEAYQLGLQNIRSNTVLFIIVFALGVLLHEGLHGLTWAIFASNGLKSIKFGIKWLYLMPYCHCSQSMKRNHYLLGGLMPGLVLGIIPTIIGFITANYWLAMLGVIFVGAAGGDFIVIAKLLQIDSKNSVQDHPDEIGFIIRR